MPASFKICNARTPNTVPVAPVIPTTILISTLLARFLHIRLSALSEHASIVFFAHEFKDFPSWMQSHFEVLGPGRGEDFGVVDRDLVGNRSWIGKPQAFGQMKLIAVDSELIGVEIVRGIQHPFF